MMIAIVQKPSPDRRTAANDRFLKMLPAIRGRAEYAFRRLPSELKAELAQAVVASAYIAFLRLVERGKAHAAFATPLASYAIRQVRAGRQPGGRSSTVDVLSRPQRFGSGDVGAGNVVESLDTFDDTQGNWRAALVEDRRAGPAETAAARIDLAAWLRLLSRRNRRIAKSLARGESTCDVARQFKLSSARISQLRAELEESWLAYQSEEPSAKRP